VAILPNGPAVGFSKRNPTLAPGRVPVPRASGARKLSRCKEGLARFLASRYKFIEHYACRGASLIGAANLSPVTNLVERTGAVSRDKLSRNHKTVKVLEINCGQMSVSGYMNHYKYVLGAGAFKNRDELIDPTVRVRWSMLFL
jgi:hypothetical protein